MMKISPNFTANELIRSQTAARRGINNRPNVEQFTNLIYLATVLEQVRSLFGSPVHITSGYRSLELNRAIGSNDNSRHVLGLAADFVVSGVSNKNVFNEIKASNIPYRTVILEFPESANGWIHLDIYPFAQQGKHRNLIAKKVNNQTQYSKIA